MLDLLLLEIRPLINIGKKRCLKVIISSYVRKHRCQNFQGKKKQRKKMSEGQTFSLSGICLATDQTFIFRRKLFKMDYFKLVHKYAQSYLSNFDITWGLAA